MSLFVNQRNNMAVDGCNPSLCVIVALQAGRVHQVRLGKSCEEFSAAVNQNQCPVYWTMMITV